MTRQRSKSGESEAPRFIADCMLGTLAKRLRSLGYDTLFFNKIDDARLVEIANTENRIILTRDTALIKRRKADKYIFIDSDNIETQLEKVLNNIGEFAKLPEIFIRCLVCNTPLNKIKKKDVIGKVPPFIFLTQSSFSYCTKCNKVYWKGTHFEHAMRRLKGK